MAVDGLEFPLTFYSVWNEVKDKPSELDYPCAVWDQWTSRLSKDPSGFLHRVQLVRLLVLASAPTQRTPLVRDQLVEAADKSAGNIVALINEQDIEMVDNVVITTMFDDGSQLETGVLLQFTIKDPNAVCPNTDGADIVIPTEGCAAVRTCDPPQDGDVLTHVGGVTVWAPPSGGGGGSFSGVVSLTVNAGETIGGHRVVMIDGSDAVYFDPTDTNNAGKMLGVSTAAASIGNDVDITTEGPVVNSGWGLTPGAVYFAIASGLLSTTPVTTGICQRIGVALDANTLNVHLSEPVTLI